MSDRLILSIDQSLSSTGFALLKAGSVIRSGSWRLCDGAKNRSLGFRELFGRISATHQEFGLDRIVHERPSFGAVNQGEDQLIGAIGLIAIIELFAESRGIPLSSYAVQQWRGTFFTKAERKAIAAKPQKVRDWKRPAIERARQLGFDPTTHDQAEAFAILDHHLLASKITPEWRGKAGAMLEPVA